MSKNNPLPLELGETTMLRSEPKKPDELRAFAKGRVTTILRGLKNFFELAFSASLYGKERRSKRR
jgi:hypothetical protein